jgi:hypothetical protein
MKMTSAAEGSILRGPARNRPPAPPFSAGSRAGSAAARKPRQQRARLGARGDEDGRRMRSAAIASDRGPESSSTTGSTSTAWLLQKKVATLKDQLEASRIAHRQEQDRVRERDHVLKERDRQLHASQAEVDRLCQQLAKEKQCGRTHRRSCLDNDDDDDSDYEGAADADRMEELVRTRTSRRRRRR